MLEELLLIVLCLLATVAGLAVAAWEVVSGRVFDMDGLWLTLISLTLAGVFGAALAWPFYTGEGQQMLRNLRKGFKRKAAQDKNSPTPT